MRQHNVRSREKINIHKGDISNRKARRYLFAKNLPPTAIYLLRLVKNPVELTFKTREPRFNRTPPLGVNKEPVMTDQLKDEKLYWECNECGTILEMPTPPEKCPHCNKKCIFRNVTCYQPSCGCKGFDPQLVGKSK